MSRNTYLHSRLGTVTMLIEPDAYTSAAVAGQFAATDNDAGIPIGAYGGYDHVLFILQVGDYAGAALATLGIQYSCDANASNAGNSTDVWASSDAYFPSIDSDGENEVYLLDFDIAGKGLPVSSNDGNAGYLFVASTETNMPGGADMAILGIPYGMNRGPTTNENAVTLIGETST